MRRLGIGTGILVVLGLLIVPGVGAQSGKDIASSLCGLYSKGQVREALQVKMAAHADPSFHACKWSTVDIGDPERYLDLGWLDISWEDLQAVQSDWVPVMLGDRSALYDPVNSALSIDLDQGVLVVSINALQSADWQGAITSLGELAVAKAADLVAPPPPDPDLVALFPTTVGGQGLLLRALHVDREFSAESGDRVKALKSALKKADRKMGDVSLASGQVSDAGIYVSALKVAGADAADFVESAIGWSIGPGWTAEPAEFVNGIVNAVTFAEGSYTRYLYPKEDVVWLVDAPEPALNEILAALPGAPALTTAADPEASASPAAGESPAASASPAALAEPAGAAGDVDVDAALPASIDGQELTKQSGEVGGFLQGKSLRLLNKALKATDKQQDDITYTLASTPDQSVGVLAFDVAGADASAYYDFMLETVLSGLPTRKHSKEQAEIGGKAVTIIQPRISAAGGALHIFVTGDVIWMVGAKDPALTEIVSAIP